MFIVSFHMSVKRRTHYGRGATISFIAASDTFGLVVAVAAAFGISSGVGLRSGYRTPLSVLSAKNPTRLLTVEIYLACGGEEMYEQYL
jgi:hypothetical protein